MPNIEKLTLASLIRDLPGEFPDLEAARAEWKRIRNAAGLAGAEPDALGRLHRQFRQVRDALQSGGEPGALRAIAEAEGLPQLQSLHQVDASEPPPVLWRAAAAGEHADAVLSVGEVAILAGPGGLGKSTLCLQWAAAAAAAWREQETGSPPAFGESAGLRVRSGPVLIVSYEDSPARMAARLQRLNAKGPGVQTWANPSPLFVADAERRGTARKCRHWRYLWDAIAAQSPGLVIVDPASAALTDTSANEGAPVRAFLGAVAAEAKAAGFGALLVAHDTKAARNAAKQGGDPGAGAVAGSSAWYDGARGVLYLRRADGGARKLECVKANYGRCPWSVDLVEAAPDGAWRGFKVAPGHPANESHHPGAGSPPEGVSW